MAHLTTPRAVIDALGGPTRVAARYGRHPNAVFHWLSTGAFPAKTWLTMALRLKRAGHTAPLELWKFDEEIDEAIDEAEAAATGAARKPVERAA